MKKNPAWKTIVNRRNRRIRMLYKKGYSYADIGRIYGMSRQLIRYICKAVHK